MGIWGSPQIRPTRWLPFPAIHGPDLASLSKTVPREICDPAQALTWRDLWSPGTQRSMQLLLLWLLSVSVPHKVLPCRCFSVSSTVFTGHTTWDANLSASLWIIPLIHRSSVAPKSQSQLLHQQYLPTGIAQLTFQHACVWTHSFPQYTFSSGSLLLLNGIRFLFILLKVIYAFPFSFTCHPPPSNPP